MKKLFKLLLVVLFFAVSANAQQTLTSIGGWNAYVHLPSSYSSNPTAVYPTIIFFPGIGEVGSYSPAVISNGPGAYIAQGWNGNVVVDGSTVEFIVISLQSTAWPGEVLMNEKIQILKNLYRIDPNRMHLTGLSHGGWCSTTFVSGDTYGGPYTYASQVASVVTVEGVQPADNQPYPNMMDNFALAGGRYVGFEQINDFRDTRTVVDRMNFTKPGSAIYVQTNFGGGGHCCWNSFYGGQGAQPTNFTLDGISQNIYQWMARQRRNGASTGNAAPAANAGNDISITLPQSSVTLAGSGTDSDGSIASYFWTKISGPAAGTITSAAVATTTVTGLAQGVYVFELKVTDNAGATAIDQVTVTVNAAPNQAPVARAGSDQSITLPVSTVNVDASGSYDPDGTIQAYNWTTISGPGTVSYGNSWVSATSISFSAAGTYTIRLGVWDVVGAGAYDTLIVTVNNATGGNQLPVAVAGPDQLITIPTNFVTVDGSASYDPDGYLLARRWVLISGPGTATIDLEWQSRTNITFSAAGLYAIELNVWDNIGALGKDTLYVTVNPAQAISVPPVANAGPDQTIVLPANSVILNGLASYDPDGTISTYMWKLLGGPGTATISNQWLSVTSVIFSNAGQYSMELTVWDNNNLSAKDTMLVTINPAVVNAAPSANAGNDISITLPQSSTTLTGSGTDSDGSITAYLWTKISGPASGTITSAASGTTTVTGLSQGVYVYELKVTDNAGATGTDQVTVTVNAAAVNQLPVANAGPDKTITLPTNTVSVDGTASYDPDGSVISYNWKFVSGPAAVQIANEWTAQTILTFSAAGTYKIKLDVGDNQAGIASDTLQVQVNAVVNTAPVANAGPDVTITQPTSQVTLSGSGTDANGTVTAYLWTKISGPAGDNIVSPTSNSTRVRSLTRGVYYYELKVTDNGGATGRDTVMVTVNAPTNVAPLANAGVDQTLQLPLTTVTLNGTSSSDADGSIAGYQWIAVVDIAGVQINSPTNSITTVSFTTPGVYTFRLTVTDNAGASSSDDINVTVLEVTSDKFVKVNIYDGKNIFNNSEWNNWKPVAGVQSVAFKYSDGSPANITANISSNARFVDNGYGYALNTTICPPEVLRINSIDAARRTLTITGLNPSGIYSFDFFASRAFTGNKTLVTIGNRSDTINTDYNITDYASFTNIHSDPTGRIDVVLDNLNVYQYLAGFIIREVQQTTGKNTHNSNTLPLLTTTETYSKITAEKAVEDAEKTTVAFPNPFTDRLSVLLGNQVKGHYKITVTNTAGAVLWTKAGNKNTPALYEQLNTANLPAGAYFVQVINNGNTSLYKVMKR